MRDLVVREGLDAMAHDAAALFRELIAAGAEIPYEVREPGDGSSLCRYEPQTARFVRDRAGALRELDSFGAACAALEASDLAGPYLETLGIGVPPEARRRAELAAVVFLCRLWSDSSDFSLDGERLEAALDEVEEGSEATEDEIEVIVPLRGLTMPVARLDLATATIFRSDTVDVPPEARGIDAMGASPWEPSFLAVTRTSLPDETAEEEAAEVGLRATNAFRRLVTTLRLYKAGGVALGPYAWVRAGSNRWRRISTGAGKPRPGGYRLGEAELGELVALSRTLSAPSAPLGRVDANRPGVAALGRAISRFEAGLERTVVLEALNDNLLALRFVLEGGGPAALGLPMRVAALCAEPDRRGEVKAVVDHALNLERSLWSGEPPAAGPIPAETATRLEELTRAILKDAACGHLGTDMRSTADEILLADGLAVGDGADDQRGATEEWELDEDGGSGLEIEVVKVSPGSGRTSPQTGESTNEEQMTFPAPATETEYEEAPTAVIEAVSDEPSVESRHPWAEPSEPEAALPRPPEPDVERIPAGSPVLRLIEQSRSERDARADRIANLFPRPEPCDWNVRELGYDRRRRAAGSS